MKSSKKLTFLILCTSVLLSCHKEKNWETEVEGVTNITAYSAKINLVYNFGSKSAKAWIGLDFGTNSELKTNFERFEQEANNTELISVVPSYLNSNQTYYVRSYMVRKNGKDTIWSEIASFTTLSELSMPCSLQEGQVYYSGNGMTESVGELVEIESPDYPDLFTYQITSGAGNLTISFRYNPSSGNYLTGDEGFVGAEDGFVLFNCWFNDGTSNCYYEAEIGQNIYVTRDSNNNVSISFCNLKLVKIDSGSCVDSQEISGKLVN